MELREIYRNLRTSKTLGKVFAKHKLTDCKRQPSNLKMLFQTFQQINQLSKQQNAVVIIEAELSKFKNWHQTFVLKSNFNCKIPNLIYVIICIRCNKEYIGNTGGQLKERLNTCRQHIR